MIDMTVFKNKEVRLAADNFLVPYRCLTAEASPIERCGSAVKATNNILQFQASLEIECLVRKLSQTTCYCCSLYF